MPRYVVKTSESRVDVDLNVNLHPSHVSARELSGRLECELAPDGHPRLDEPWAAELALPVASIKSGIGLQDREMRRRFDTRRYPSITAKLVDARELDQAGRYQASFELSMHGQTRRVDGEARLQVGDRRLTIDGEQQINMKDFGIDPPRLIILKVDPVVNIRAHIVAEEEQQ